MRMRFFAQGLPARQTPTNPPPKQSTHQTSCRRKLRAIPPHLLNVVAAAKPESIPPVRTTPRRVLPFRLRRQPKTQRLISFDHAAQYCTRVDPFNEAVWTRDLLPRNMSHRPQRLISLRRILAHHLPPKRLRHRRARNIKISNLDRTPIHLPAKEKRHPTRARNAHKFQFVRDVTLTPFVLPHLH